MSSNLNGTKIRFNADRQKTTRIAKYLDHGCWDVADIAKLQKHLYKLQTYQAFGHTKN